MALWLGSLLVAAAMLARLGAAADNAPADAPASGQLLIAAATIQDPRFYHGVILLVRCDAKGAFGIMINRPLGERPIADLLAGDDAAKDRDGKTAPAGGMIRVFLGGPVEPQYGFVIHSTDYRSAATVAVADGIAMTATRAILRDIVRHRGPRQYRFAIGYSGWSAGQLDGEIARRDWFVAPATPDLVFDADTDRIWRTALSRRTQEL
ncbi:MAG TPA: YqgE/AlgH family protein [Stellaceae bacterium]|nr:YqgE/AlgH family protein [Stellaceae bacterium]